MPERHERRRRRHRLRAALAAAMCALVSLTGCMTGDGVASAFRQEFSADPAIESLDLSSADNMPFTGGVGGMVILRDGASDEQVRDVSGRIVEFAAGEADRRGEARVRIDIEVGEWRIPVLTETETNEAVLDLALAQRADAASVSGDIGSQDHRSDVTHVALHAVDAPSAFALFGETAGRFSERGLEPAITVAAESASEGSVELSGRPGPWLERAQHAYDGLRAEVALTSFRAEQDAFTVTVGSERDAPEAASIARAALGVPGIEVFVESNIVTLFPGATGDTVRSILADMGDERMETIDTVWTDDRTAAFHLKSVVDAEELAGVLAEDPRAAMLETITVSSGRPDEPTLELEETPSRLADSMRPMADLVARDGVEAVRRSAGYSIELVVADDVADDDLGAYAPGVKDLAEPGERLCVEQGDGAFCLVAAPRIDADDAGPRAAKQGRAFIESWNSAP